MVRDVETATPSSPGAANLHCWPQPCRRCAYAPADTPAPQHQPLELPYTVTAHHSCCLGGSGGCWHAASSPNKRKREQHKLALSCTPHCASPALTLLLAGPAWRGSPSLRPARRPSNPPGEALGGGPASRPCGPGGAGCPTRALQPRLQPLPAVQARPSTETPSCAERRAPYQSHP